jgi:hypothetical protein
MSFRKNFCVKSLTKGARGIDISSFLRLTLVLNQMSTAAPLGGRQQLCLPRFLTHHNVFIAIGAFAIFPAAGRNQSLRVDSDCLFSTDYPHRQEWPLSGHSPYLAQRMPVTGLLAEPCAR